MNGRVSRGVPAALLLATLGSPVRAQTVRDAYPRMAERIATALAPQRGERAILRYHPDDLPGFPAVLQARLERVGVEVDPMPYGPADDFDDRLAAAGIYVWLPDPSGGTLPAQAAALARWLDTGRGRQIHFHWGAGAMAPDGLQEAHAPAYDVVYVDALDIDYAALRRAQDATVAALRSGRIRVTTPAGTDIVFEVGDRPFNRQDGDASSGRMASARIRIDREIELPAGVIRVAPLETTVNGTMVLPSSRWDEITLTDLRLEFTNGVVTGVADRAGSEAGRALIGRHFRELGIGFNPRLVTPAGHRWIPYYGYGAGVVRMSLGDNEEIGGAVRDEPVRWLFFTDATVSVAGRPVVRDGQLVGRP